ncbi:YaaA family protein [Candidatus Lucifugimonas marina]|uniref:Peroxide stress protein YaaA n=2 Tax=Candidatus Lucifugimonas marina TaxID=3038979 RepID=A0ABD4XLB9_9CHLR|nr:peroxide stress protein YaaA [SAR202 cluster bacterium JH702]MDG0869222.1 peroxide stress protein YaaA [SAR202 cluster bacterium JH639]WFG35839.1 peroxide stress protein YaaA [SAR202 cluster bacterium JH545]
MNSLEVAQWKSFKGKLAAMTSNLLILLPPSEGKASGGEGPPLNLESLSFDEFSKSRTLMIKALGQLSGKPRVAQKILGVKGAALDKARADNADVLNSPTITAIERYTGVMYDSIDYQSLDADSQRVFGENTIIMSGLFGMVRPFDLIPTYKLKMGAKIRLNKSCSTIWKPLISKALKSTADNGVIWDLLPNEHSAAWDPSKISCDVRFTVKFLEAGRDGKLKTVSHWSKALKGALVRHLVANPKLAGSADTALGLLENFSHPEGYKYRPEMTAEVNGATEIVFLKTV